MASEVARVARRLEAAKESKILGKQMKYNNRFSSDAGNLNVWLSNSDYILA